METHTSQKIEYINIGDLVREIERKFQVDPHHRDWKGKQEINIRCPKCTDKKFHLGLSFAKNAYNCFRCPFQGRLSDFLKRNGIKYETKTNVYTPEVVSPLAPKIKMPIDLVRDEKVASKAKSYMVSRGFDLRFVKQNFRIWPITDYNHYYFGYIIIALNDYAFYGRKFLDLTPRHQKHIIRKTDTEMKLYYTYEKNNSRTMLVVESMFNLIKAAQYGYDAVCIFGKGNWASLVEFIKKNPTVNLCLCFDKDVIIKDIDRFITRVKKSCDVSNIFYIDPSDMPCNDIADMTNREMLAATIAKKKNIEELFISSMSIGE